MESLPQELLDEVFMNLVELYFPDTARFSILSATTRQTIQNCRLVQRRWNGSARLEQRFLWVLEETPFVWHNHRIPKLEAIGETQWGNMMRTLSLCGMDLGLTTLGTSARCGADRDDMDEETSVVRYLTHLLRGVSWVEGIRYYPISPKCLDGTWLNWKVNELDDRHERGGYPPLQEGEHSWLGVREENEWIYARIVEAVDEAHLWIESFDMPLFGNRAPHCAVDTTRMGFWGYSMLTRVSISITKVWGGDLHWPFLEAMQSLEYLDVSLSLCPELRNHGRGFLPPASRYNLIYRRTATENYCLRLPKVKEFRLMADNQYSFATYDILEFLSMFPNLSRVGFAHIMLVHGTWQELCRNLVPWQLERLWLISPREVTVVGTRTPVWPALPYQGDQTMEDAATEVKLVHTESPPTTANGVPERTRNFEYPGFTMFDRLDD
jgi:hypothetical protein